MRYIYMVAIMAIAALSPAQAEVTNKATNGFTIKHQAEINASSDEVWKNLIAPARWWNGAHSWSGNAENFYLVPQAGGCFCELLKTKSDDNIKSSDGSVQHMRVIFVQNRKVLRMSGALGPLQGEALTGTLTIELKAQGDKTAARFTYKVGGYMEFPVDEIALAVDGVIGEQLNRLAALYGAKEEKPKESAEEDDSKGENFEEEQGSDVSDN